MILCKKCNSQNTVIWENWIICNDCNHKHYNNPDNVLYLTLKKKWFDMILSGVKKEEYREIKPYWDKRLNSKSFKIIEFKKGYFKSAPKFYIQCLGINKGLGIISWGAPEATEVYILHLGSIIYSIN